MDAQVIVAGGGIGGLGATVALARRGVPVTVIEQAPAFGEVGAGLQLGPNAVRVLHDWGLAEALQAVAAWPELLRVRDARDGRELGRLRLGDHFARRFGQAYACVHRVDLHALLLRAALAAPGVAWRLDTRLLSAHQDGDGVQVHIGQGEPGRDGAGAAEALQAQALLGCDGLWSRVRPAVLADTPPVRTGHVAYRGLVPAARLPAALRQLQVQAWLGARLHVVHYPVRRGEAWNVVAVVHEDASAPRDPQSWSEPATPEDLARAIGPVHAGLQGWLEAVPGWTRWVLNDRDPVPGPQAMARGRIALLGDAAHPMRPYLAQGAAMALEDAWTLGQLLAQAPAGGPPDWPALLGRYAMHRWARDARVQRRSRRNGVIFHAQGGLRLARNSAMALLGERLLENGWLYAGPPGVPRAG